MTEIYWRQLKSLEIGELVKLILISLLFYTAIRNDVAKCLMTCKNV